MLENERRDSGDRRKADTNNLRSPFLTTNGLVFTERRKNSDRRNLRIDEMMALGDVEEIELKPVSYV